MTKDELFAIVRRNIDAKKAARKHPSFVLLKDLLDEVGREHTDTVCALLNQLYLDGRIKPSETFNDKYIDIPDEYSQ